MVVPAAAITVARSASLRTSNGMNALQHHDESALAMPGCEPVADVLVFARQVQYADTAGGAEQCLSDLGHALPPDAVVVRNQDAFTAAQGLGVGIQPRGICTAGVRRG